MLKYMFVVCHYNSIIVKKKENEFISTHLLKIPINFFSLIFFSKQTKSNKFTKFESIHTHTQTHTNTHTHTTENHFE